MLRKLLKYEFASVGRVLIPLYGALIVLSVITGAQLKFSKINEGFLDVIFILLLVSGSVAALVITAMILIRRFSSNLLGDEGYYTLSIPASMNQHILSKTLTASGWALIGIITAILIGKILGSFASGTDFAPLKATMKEKGMLTIVILEMVFIVLTWASWLALKIYASISIGHISQKLQGLIAVGVFLALSVIESFIGTVLIRASSPVRNVTAVDYSFAALTGDLFLSIVIGLIYSAIYFFITSLILRKKLNLR